MSVKEADMGKVDSYIRGILTAEGDDFIDALAPGDPLFNHSRIIFELGNGGIKTVRLGPPDESGRRFAVVSGSEWGYFLAGWAAERLFRDAAYFEKQ
jgi:hypothetical protein